MKQIILTAILALCSEWSSIETVTAESSSKSLLRGSNIEAPQDQFLTEQSGVASANNDHQLETSRNLQEQQGGGRQRQVIHVFFEEIEDQSLVDIDANRLLEDFKAAWSEMGWEPRVITLEDAKRHPKYWQFEHDLRQVPLEHPNKPTERSRMLYLRWLAMAAVGGGWMAEVDTIPLRPPIPSDAKLGKFHVYEGPGLPTLMKGSEGEWTRMAELLVQTGIENHSSPHWSDAMGLVSVINSGKCECDLFDIVLEANNVLDGKRVTRDSCDQLKNYIAVHFSTYALLQSQTEDVLHGKDWRHKSRIMKDWADEYRSACSVL